jgi:cytosine/adenosine deaminase-related metal-dependent hydrolase
MKSIMKSFILSLFFVTCFQAFAQTSSSLILIGQMPGRYFKDADAHKYVFGFLEIQNRVIQKMGILNPEGVKDFEKQNAGKQIVHLKRPQAEQYDVIYPGLINLHNHTKQNNLPIWGAAVGQFANRFEWRDWPNYKYTVSGNMNPWVDYARAIECATYRWSELHAMTLGTIYLQGPSSCVNDFAIQRVEDAGSFVSAKAGVQAPTDLVMPNEMQFVWNVLGPIIKTGKTYEQALAQTIKQYCPTIAVTPENVNGPEMLKIFKDQAQLVSLCQKEGLPDKFIRYVYWIHPTVAGRKNYFAANAKAPYSAVIAHLAEGRRDDDYNQKEYQVVKMLGLDVAQMNFVHGVGIPSQDYPELAQKNIGLIWSPFSNLILYSQTLDIANAHKAGVRLALGSDWVPTGTKSVLEEVKIARRYIVKDIDKEGLVAALSDGTGKMEVVDETLFEMITENPAKMIGHYDIKKGIVTKKNPSGYLESGVGRLAEGAMGSVIVVSYQDKNPYTNLVVKADEKDINLVVVDGRAVYGNKSYLDRFGIAASQYEVLPVDSEDYSKLKDAPVVSVADKSPEGMMKHIVGLVTEFSKGGFKVTDKCQFNEAKAFVSQKSVEADEDLKSFRIQTGIDLDRVSDITRLLAINILTQNRNKIDPEEGKKDYSLTYFPALYSCNDPAHQARLANFIKDGGDDDLEKNRKFRKEIIENQKLGRGPAQLAEKYRSF